MFSQWEKATIRGVGWSDKEELLIVSEDGTVRRYIGLDGEFTSFSLGNVSRRDSSFSYCNTNEEKGCRRVRRESLPVLVIGVGGITLQ